MSGGYGGTGRSPSETAEAGRPPGPASGGRRPLRRRLAPILAAFALAGVLIGAHVAAYPLISVFDEGVHFDYVRKASSGQLVRKGDRIGQETMREMACRGIDQIEWVYPECSSTEAYDPRQFPASGYNSADIHPPVYYFLTGVVSRLFTSTGLVSNPLDAARYVGILWLGLGLITIWYAGRELDIPPRHLVVGLLLLAANPWVLHAASTVNNDQAAILAGGAVALATLRWESGKWPLWTLGLVALIVPLFKVTNVIAVALCLIYLAIRRRPRSEKPPRAERRGPALAWLLGGASLTAVTWIIIRSALARPIITPIEVWFPPSDAPVEHVFGQLTALVTPVSQRLPSAVLDEPLPTALGSVFGILIVAACIWPLLAGTFRDRKDALAASGGLAMLVGGMLFATTNFVLFGATYGISPRYGLSLVPALGLAVAGSLRWRGSVWAVGVLAALTATVTLLTLLAAT